MSGRSPFIVHWQDVREADEAHYPGSDELLSIGSPLARATGITGFGAHHEILLPGRRTSFPHAEADEDELIFVLEGAPQVWIDGELHPLRVGDAVGFPRGTGHAHTFINDTADVVRLFVVGEASHPSHRVHYPLHPDRNAAIGDGHWKDAPARPLGPHPGTPARASQSLVSPTLETERLILRPVRVDDAAAIFDMRTQPDVMRYLGRTAPATVQEVEDIVRMMRARIDRLESIAFAVTVRGDDRLVGIVVLLKIDRQNATGEIGYELHRDLWGRGLVREAIDKLVDHAFEALKLHRLEIRTDPANGRSIRIAEALGFRQEAHLREHGLYPDGRRLDTLVFGKLATER